MIEANKQNLSKKTYTAKDYVGSIISMHDGIENAGFGKITESGKWLDCVHPSFEIPVASITDAKFLPNCVEYTTLRMNGLDIPSPISDVIKTGRFTIEYVTSGAAAENQSNSRGNVFIYGLVYDHSGNALKGGSCQFTSYLMRQDIASYPLTFVTLQSSGHGAYVPNPNPLSIHSGAIAPLDDVYQSKLFIDGKFIAQKTDYYGRIRPDSSNVSLYIGDNSYGEGEKTDVRCYAIRIHDRMLSEEEIAYNFAIDKVRFGV